MPKIDFIHIKEGNFEQHQDLLEEYAAIVKDDLASTGQDIWIEAERSWNAYAGSAHGHMEVATIDGAKAACAAIKKLTPERAEIKRLYVRPAFRGHGIARQLVQRMIDHARALGYAELVLDSATHLQSAIALYDSMGFQPIEPYYSPDPGPNYIFRKLEL